MGLFPSKERKHIDHLVDSKILQIISDHKPKYYKPRLVAFLKSLGTLRAEENKAGADEGKREAVVKKAIENQQEFGLKDGATTTFAIIAAKEHHGVSTYFLAEHYKTSVSFPVDIGGDAKSIIIDPFFETVYKQWEVNAEKIYVSKFAEILSKKGMHRKAHKVYEVQKLFGSSLKELVLDGIEKRQEFLTKAMSQEPDYKNKIPWQKSLEDNVRAAEYIKELIEKRTAEKSSKKRTHFITDRVYEEIQGFLLNFNSPTMAKLKSTATVKQLAEIKFKALNVFLNMYDKLFDERKKVVFYDKIMKKYENAVKSEKISEITAKSRMYDLNYALQKIPSEKNSVLLKELEFYFAGGLKKEEAK